MKKTVTAKLRWLTEQQGGRASLPSGAYSTVARFDHQSDNDWQNNAWSVVIEFIEAPNFDASSRVRVSFLVENAPNDWLSSGRSFELFEGKKLVARGQVD